MNFEQATRGKKFSSRASAYLYKRYGGGDPAQERFYEEAVLNAAIERVQIRLVSLKELDVA